MTSETDQVNGRVSGLAYYWSPGPRPLLLLAHGYGDSGGCWERLVARFSGVFDVVAFDARGHGASDRASAPFDPADDIECLLTELESEPAVVLGHSVGAAAAVALAARRPDLVDSLVLEDPPWHDVADSDVLRERGRLYRQEMAAVAEMSLEEVVAAGGRVHPEWPEDELPAWARAKQQLQPDLHTHLRLDRDLSVLDGVAAPTLVIHGERALGSMVDAERCDARWSDRPLICRVEIAGAGHNVRRERFDAYARAVEEFLG